MDNKWIEDAFEEENPDAAFENLILKLSKEGNSKTEIYNFLYNYYIMFSESKSYLKIEEKHGDHPVEIAMDRLWGYCSPHQLLLPNETIEK